MPILLHVGMSFQGLSQQVIEIKNPSFEIGLDPPEPVYAGEDWGVCT